MTDPRPRSVYRVRRGVIAFILGAAMVFPVPLLAQGSRADTLEIERVVAQALHDSLKVQSVAFDSRVLAGSSFGDERAAAHVEVLAKALHTKAVHEPDVLTCAGNPSTCQLSVDAFVALAAPRVSRTAAIVLVRIRTASRVDRGTFTTRDDMYSVGKVDGRWRVTDIHTIKSP